MVAVALHEVADVAFVPFVEETCVVEFGLALAPHVHGLVYHHETHLVAQVEKLRCRRIVGAAYGIAAHLLEHLKFPLNGAAVHRSPETAHVMMQADAEQLDRIAIEEEALVGIPGDAAETEFLPVLVRPADGIADFDRRGIAVGILYVPEPRGRHRYVCFIDGCATVRATGSGSAIGHPAAPGIADCNSNAFRGALDFGPHVRLFPFGAHEHSVVCNMRISHGDEPYVAVDSAAGVPAGIRLVGIVTTHRDHIVLTGGVELVRDVVAERTVTVRTRSGRQAVHIDGAVHEDAVELDHRQAAAGSDSFRRREMLPVPAYASRKCTATGSGRVVLAEFAFYAPVVREMQTAPGSVVESGRSPLRRSGTVELSERTAGKEFRTVAESESPIKIEVLDDAGTSVGTGCQQERCQRR